MKLHQALILLFGLSHQGKAWMKRSKSEVEVGVDRGEEKLAGHQDVLAAFDTDFSNQGSIDIPPSPSCFFLALSSLPTNSPCETLAHSDSQRSEIAVKMALCEIGTAQNGRSPRECVEWSKEKESLGHCIEALSRSPQYWASYSGYLRDIVTHCSTFRRWADIEFARELHKSSASTFHDVLARLRKYEEVRSERRAREAVVFDDLRKDLASLSSKLFQSTSNIESDHTLQFENAKRMQTELSTLLIDLHTLPTGLRDSIRSIAEDHGDLLDQLARMARQEVQEVVEMHRTSLSELSTQADQRLSSNLDRLAQELQSVSDQVSDINDHLASSLDTVKAVQSVATELHQALVNSHTTISVQTSELSVRQAELGSRIENSLSRIDQFASALQNLTEQARSPRFDSLTSRWESLIDIVWWIRLLFGFISDGIGLSNLCFGAASIIVSYFYPSLTSLIGIVAIVFNCRRFLRLSRSLRVLIRPRRSFPSSSSSSVPSARRSPTSPFVPPRSQRASTSLLTELTPTVTLRPYDTVIRTST